MQRVHHTPPLFDPGWLFLLAGLALLGATTLVGGQHEVESVRLQRDRTLAAETHRAERLARYEEFLGALQDRQPALVESLASSQLNQVPAERATIPGTVRDNLVDASVFPALEPPPLRLPRERIVNSALTRLTTNDATRVWLLAGSAMLILVGLLPPSRGWGRPSRRGVPSLLDETPSVAHASAAPHITGLTSSAAGSIPAIVEVKPAPAETPAG